VWRITSVLDAALTLFAKLGYHGRHAMYAQPGRDPHMSARGSWLGYLIARRDEIRNAGLPIRI
jgi:hypothetical protein